MSTCMYLPVYCTVVAVVNVLNELNAVSVASSINATEYFSIVSLLL